MQKITAKAGAAGASKVAVKARGANLPDGLSTLDPNGTVVVQVRTSEGTCWGARCSRPSRNEGARYKAVSD